CPDQIDTRAERDHRRRPNHILRCDGAEEDQAESDQTAESQIFRSERFGFVEVDGGQCANGHLVEVAKVGVNVGATYVRTAPWCDGTEKKKGARAGGRPSTRKQKNDGEE